MKRGAEISGRAAATAGLNRSVWPTASTHAALARSGEQPIRLGQRARHRLLDEHVHAALEERLRDLQVRLGRHGHCHGVHLAEQRRASRSNGGDAVRLRRSPRPARRSMSTTPTSSTPGSAARIRA